jgi:hypothetical protein
LQVSEQVDHAPHSPYTHSPEHATAAAPVDSSPLQPAHVLLSISDVAAHAALAIREGGMVYRTLVETPSPQLAEQADHSDH